MSPNEFWYGDCYLCQAYLEKAKIERQRTDFDQWKQGLYIHDAVSVAIARCVNGDRKAKYPEHPYEYEEKHPETRVMNEALTQFEAFVAVHNAKKKVENG